MCYYFIFSIEVCQDASIDSSAQDLHHTYSLPLMEPSSCWYPGIWIICTQGMCDMTSVITWWANIMIDWCVDRVLCECILNISLTWPGNPSRLYQMPCNIVIIFLMVNEMESKRKWSWSRGLLTTSLSSNLYSLQNIYKQTLLAVNYDAPDPTGVFLQSHFECFCLTLFFSLSVYVTQCVQQFSVWSFNNYSYVLYDVSDDGSWECCILFEFSKRSIIIKSLKCSTIAWTLWIFIRKYEFEMVWSLAINHRLNPTKVSWL